jgi:3-mercaptopyruvate sulfurtransferase SseA
MGDVESNLTALKMASLKGIKKSTKVLILDVNGGEGPKLAKSLAQQGFGKVFVIEGGFGGWQSAGLGVKQARSVSATLMPSFGRFISGGSSSSSRVIDVTPNFLGLPSGRD